MSEKRFYLDIHAIQTLPPSNVNRDDTGSPKTAIYGGIRRARVSSQAWKSAIRQYLKVNLGIEIGERTIHLVKKIAETIIDKNPSVPMEEAKEMANTAINNITENNKKVTKDNKKKSEKYPVAEALFFISNKQVEGLAEAAIRGEKDRNVYHSIILENPSVDMSLFGRMLATDSSINIDASCQVAHSISTHEVQIEFDYFTAIDDMAPENNAGAEMIETIEDDSSTLYRYANIAMHELFRQLGSKEQAIDAAKLFIQAFANSMPTGKSNTFANQTLPQLLMINIRRDRPVSLVTAYENPVKSREGYVKPSIERLFDEVKKTEKFVQVPEKTLYVVEENIEKPEWATEEDNISALMDDFAKIAEELL